jgi:hypothetical protein
MWSSVQAIITPVGLANGSPTGTRILNCLPLVTPQKNKKQKAVVTDVIVDIKKRKADEQRAELFGQHFAKVGNVDNLDEPFKSIKKIVEHYSKEKI